MEGNSSWRIGTSAHPSDACPADFSSFRIWGMERVSFTLCASIPVSTPAIMHRLLQSSYDQSEKRTLLTECAATPGFGIEPESFVNLGERNWSASLTRVHFWWSDIDSKRWLFHALARSAQLHTLLMHSHGMNGGPRNERGGSERSDVYL